MKERLGLMFFLAIVFTMCAVTVRLLLLVFGSGLEGIAFCCLAVALLLLLMLRGINPD